MSKIKLLFMGIILITLSCSKEESDIRLSEFDAPIITGFEERDEQSNVIRAIGNPNVKLGNESNDYTSDYFFTSYPNPSRNSFQVSIKTPNPNSTQRVWIVQAQYYENGTSTANIGGTTLLDVGGDPLIQYEGILNNLELDVSGLSEGYYRIYLQVDDLILYDNLVITNN